MNKKIFLFIIFATVIIFTLPLKADAIETYVGVQIVSAQAPGCTPGTTTCPGTATNSNWCLPAGSDNITSKIVITTTNSCSYFDDNYDPTYVCQYNYCGSNFCLSNSVSVVKPICAGDDPIWLGPIVLNSGIAYRAYLYVPNFCPGYISGSCWVSGQASENCCAVCERYGLTSALYYGGTTTDCQNSYCLNSGNNDQNCRIEAALKGSACSVCNQGHDFNYFSGDECYTTYNAPWPKNAYGNCDWSDPQFSRVCACNFPNMSTGFSFTFTAP